MRLFILLLMPVLMLADIQPGDPNEPEPTPTLAPLDDDQLAPGQYLFIYGVTVEMLKESNESCILLLDYWKEVDVPLGTSQGVSVIHTDEDGTKREVSFRITCRHRHE